jgi:hypothetical protein
VPNAFRPCTAFTVNHPASSRQLHLHCYELLEMLLADLLGKHEQAIIKTAGVARK